VAYTIKQVKPIFIELLNQAGATDIECLTDHNISKKVRDRIVVAKYNGVPFSVICFPIVLRTKAKGKDIAPQRYIDINSSAWSGILQYWKMKTSQKENCFLMAMRSVDDEIGEYIFSIEGELDHFSGKSIYIHANHMHDIGNNLNIDTYTLEKEKTGSMTIFKTELLDQYVDSFTQYERVKGINFDYITKLENENISVVSCAVNTEGRRLMYYTTKYERSLKNRNKAIDIHGTICKGCKFDFEKTYGERGKGFIEIHHLKPLSDLNEEIEVNPEEDLVPLCSNCHRMIHRKKKEILTIEELQRIVAENLKE